MDVDLNTILLLLLTVFLVLMNAFFVATEFALVKVRSSRLKELADSGNTAAKHASTAIRQLDAYLSATQLGITLASLGLGWIGGPAIADRVITPLFHALGWQSEGWAIAISIILAFLLITFIHIVFGELAPKSLAIQRAEGVMLRVALPMRAFHWLFRPFIFVMNGAANATLRLFRITPASGHELAHTAEELRMIISASDTEHGGELRESQAELLDNVFDFGNRLARHIMRHRTEIQMLDVTDSLEENVRIAQDGNHSRYPVIQEDIDTVIGFVHTKDLFPLFQRDPRGDIHSVIRKALVVPESIRVDQLLRQMQRERQHMAILVDEYGGTSGIVTVSDLLEELVGDLPDEFEPAEEEWVIRLNDTKWSVDGRLPVVDLEEHIQRELPCDESCDTVGGYVFWAFGRIPEESASIEKDGVNIRVLAMDGRRVSRVEITINPVETEEKEHNGVLARNAH